ncbi:E3 SUMO-protein ligase ZNF451 [Callorhinchus milii]|uniref:Zinc finger protein 451 n=1 Tax=Callorhinchus milii TaxID=7868 RepID=A0A4W3JFD8_CALMI|nr:E3 SUMO-protein ligase ZNF451 [Callorhinchus milii]|eukprot:gi/632953172/ref/XP_007892260.1/ PREDICTED: zinc finger protein 451 [Callorhinchus milii]
MSSSDGPLPVEKRESEEEVVFVSEQPIRPILDYIDLSSDEDTEGSDKQLSQPKQKTKDHIDWQKRRVISTLDRLARHVEVEKQLKEEKCKAFQEKMDSQHAHGLQELEFIQGQTAAVEEARRCVDWWLKVPGLKPGCFNLDRRAVKRHPVKPLTVDPIDCPVMNCNRQFDHKQLLLGHLKRFDHSPCDPTITLHGCPSVSYICVVCYQRFLNVKQYEDHVSSKASSQDTEGHQPDLQPQIVQCYACPTCYLFFNLRDQCLQHMAKRSHFVSTHALPEEPATRCPLPIPGYAKKLLVSLCQEVPFQVKCTACQQKLRTHTEVTAHFRTRCRKAGPIAMAAKSISQVAAIFKVCGRCLDCGRLFVSEEQVRQHSEATSHSVQWIQSMERAILEFCRFNENSKTPSDLRMLLDQSKGKKQSPFKRPLVALRSGSSSEPTVSKRIRLELNGEVRRVKEERRESEGLLGSQTWRCECQQSFESEKTAETHVMVANDVRYRCQVCGKRALEAGIIGLHMSRIHGGAHLSSFHFWCSGCQAELPSREDLMAHIGERHSGHTYYYIQGPGEEEEEGERGESPMDFEPSGPSQPAPGVKPEVEGVRLEPGPPVTGPPSPTPDLHSPSEGAWQCALCGEMFESEESVARHCGAVGSHQFHRYSCGLCGQRFHLAEMACHHCMEQHAGQVRVKYFCGLCDDVVCDCEQEFLRHYHTFHSTEYLFLRHRDAAEGKDPEQGGHRLSCGCRANYSSKKLKKEDESRCAKTLFETGRLWYRCGSCPSTAQSLGGMRAHLLDRHDASLVDKGAFVIKCASCHKSFINQEAAQMHYHSKHAAPRKPPRLDQETPGDGAEASTSRKGLKATEEKEGVTAMEEELCLPDLDYLRTMTHLVFIDLDNWAGFFKHLPGHLNQGTFFWGFKGGKTVWKQPENCPIYNYLVNTGSFFLHPPCSDRKDAADFAICMHAGRMDEQLPKHIPFTVLSGDKGFEELKNQLKKTMRPGHVLNPHHMEGEMMCALLNSISDIGKGSDDEDDALQEALAVSLEESLKKQVTVDEDTELEEAILRSLEEK